MKYDDAGLNGQFFFIVILVDVIPLDNLKCTSDFELHSKRKCFRESSGSATFNGSRVTFNMVKRSS